MPRKYFLLFNNTDFDDVALFESKDDLFEILNIKAFDKEPLDRFRVLEFSTSDLKKIVVNGIKLLPLNINDL